MITTTETYKCPGCGNALIFDAEKQQMLCSSCGNTYSVEDIRQLSQIDSDMSSGDGLEWQTYESDAWSSEESQRLHSYHCPSCGSEVMAEDSVAALNCVYCGNPLVLSDEFTGMAKPDGIVPFALTKEQAMEKLGGYLKGKMLLPSAFKTGNRIEEINGVYVPFWLFNCATDSDVTYKATRTRTRHRGDYMYTDTMHYRLRRGGNLSFADVPADASLKMDDTLMESIEPFKPSEGKEFTLPYLAGYSAQKADVGIDKCKPRVNARIKNSVEAALRGTISGYATVTQQNSAVRIQHGMVKQVMMPVWMLNTRFKEKDYTFAMNGQTGHFVGDLPCSFLKGAAWFLGIAGIPSLVSWLLMRNSGNSRFLPLVIILSLIAALVTVLVMRGKMKTVKKKKEASNYTVPGSFCLTRSQDIYLYTTTTRTRVANSSQRPGQRPGAHR